MRNYISFNIGGRQQFVFFNDDDPHARLPPPGGSVFRRPTSYRWVGVPEIVGEYDETPIENIVIGGE